jgi:type IV pilus assembly protein PilA
MARNLRQEKGFTLVDMLFVCALIGILSAIGVPHLVMAKQAAGSASAIGSMRAINSGQLSFALSCGGGFYAADLTTLGKKPAGSPEAFLSPNLTIANKFVKSGYTIQMSGTPYAGAPATCNGLGVGTSSRAYKAGADPIDPDNRRFFATNADNQVYEDMSAMYPTMPESGEPASGHTLY